MALIINSEKGDINFDAEEVLDLTDKGVKKLEKCGNGNLKCLLLDTNELARLENVESYGDLLKLSVTNNKLVRMYGVCRLVHLRVLNLANNSIVAIEGMRELIHLTWLRLSGNKIKLIEHLSSNGALEYLDLSNNCIASLANLCHLKVLHTLNLDDNNIKTIHHAANYLPATLTVLSLANNELTDLNQISYLCSLPNLENVSITNNPCAIMTGCEVGFDYRPFVINWCQNLKLLDGFMVGSKESLKAEWLYSMGKGRHFQPGEHAELAEYLSGVCPLTSAEDLVSEEDAKLSRILNKRRQHQQQLLQELSSTSSSPPPATSSGGQRRPATAPAHSASSTNLGSAGVCGHAQSNYAVERSASASVVTQLPNRMTASFSGPSSSATTFVGGVASSAMSMSMSASVSHHKSVSPARHSPASKKKSSEIQASKYVDDPPVGQFDLVGLMSRSYPGHYDGDDTTMFIVSPPDVPSDVPELGQGCDSDAESPIDGGGSSQFLLRSESQYVPVPETMLSPDFRPVPVLGGGEPFDESTALPTGSDAQPQGQPPTPEPDARPRWLQRSAIPRSTFAHSPPPPSPSTGSNSHHHHHHHQQPQYDSETVRASSAAAVVRAAQGRASATDSPILRRPTQVLRLQRTARPLSLSPSCGRRSPAVPSRPFTSATTPTARTGNSSTTTAATTSSSDDDSTDSDVSVSKLALVREAAQTKMDAIVRRSMASSMESSLEGPLANEVDSSPSSVGGQADVTVAAAAAVMAAKTTALPMTNGGGSGIHDCWPRAWTERDGTSAAVKVQALWRGFRARRCDPRVVAVRQEMRVRRAEDNVQNLTTELARARRDLDQERRLRELQMEAIRALWKEVQNLQDAIPDQEETERATPCDSGLDSPNPTASTCSIDGGGGGSGPAPNGGGVVSQPRRVGGAAITTVAKAAATKTTRTTERSTRSADESFTTTTRTRTSSGSGSPALATKAGSSIAASGKVASPRPGQRSRARRDVNENGDPAVAEKSTVAAAKVTAVAKEPASSKSLALLSAPENPVQNVAIETSEVGAGDASAAEKMVHLTDTCNNLQSQVQQLQEALRTISCLLVGSHLQNRPITSESLPLSFCPTSFTSVPAATTSSQSPPFFSATASPLGGDGRPCIPTAKAATSPRQADSLSPKIAESVDNSKLATIPHVNGFDLDVEVKGRGHNRGVEDKKIAPTLTSPPETANGIFSKKSIDRLAEVDVTAIVKDVLQRTTSGAEPGAKVVEGQLPARDK